MKTSSNGSLVTHIEILNVARMSACLCYSVVCFDIKYIL